MNCCFSELSEQDFYLQRTRESGVFSVNVLFMSRYEIIARNANYTRHDMT